MQEKISDIKHLIQTDIHSAREAAEQLLTSLEQGTDADRANIYHLMGLVAYYDNKAQDAIKWYVKELKLREKIKDKKGASDVLNNIGAIYYNKGDLEKAKLYYQKALSHSEALNDQRGAVKIYNNIGALLLKSGDIGGSYAMHSKALAINRELEDTERIGFSLQNIGLTYFSQGDYESALSHLLEALAMSQSINDRVTALFIMINIGSALIKQNKFTEAQKYYEQCYEESKTINNHHGLIVSLQSLAYIEQSQGHYQESIRYYSDCIKIAETTQHVAEITTALSGIGLSYSSLGDYAQALRYLNEALQMAKKTGIKDSISDIYLRLSEVHEHLKDYKKSLEFYRKHISIRDQIVNKETTKTISEIKTRYEVEKKEKEAQLLHEKHEAINIYARKLEVSNNELKQFAHVASHDLREPLRMVSSYLILLERTLGMDITEDQKQFISFAVDGARRMDTLIHDLLRLAKVDANPKITAVSLCTVIDEVKNNIEILLREKNAQILISPSPKEKEEGINSLSFGEGRGEDALPTIMADRTQVMQLLQNIIGNGIKYNESECPTISISYELRDGMAHLRIADNGIGIPAEYRERAFQIFQRVPTAKAYQGSGIGLAICKKVVDGMGGTISINDREGGGTVFHLLLPTALLV